MECAGMTALWNSMTSHRVPHHKVPVSSFFTLHSSFSYGFSPWVVPHKFSRDATPETTAARRAPIRCPTPVRLPTPWSAGAER